MPLLLFLFSCNFNQEAVRDPQKSDWYVEGKKVYERNCIGCHKQDGEGVDEVFPPLRGAQWIAREPELIASIVARGLGGEITVRGETYRSAMPPQYLSGQQTHDVIAYIRYELSQKLPDFTRADIEKIKKAGGGTIYGEAELYELYGR